MLQAVGGAHSLLGHLLQQFVDEVGCLRRKEGREGGRGLSDSFEGLLPAEVVEGGLSCKEFVGKHADAPHIYTGAVLLACDNFGRDVVGRPTVGHPQLIADGRPAEVP